MGKGSICFRGGKILRKGVFLEEDLWISEGKIVEPLAEVDQEIDATGFIVAPGYIDCQVNGAYGYDFNRDNNALERISQFLPRQGVTSFLPTLISATQDEYQERLMSLRSQWTLAKGAIPLGIHLEGPFLNGEHAGAHQKLQSVCNPLFYGSLESVKMITLAPEMLNASETIAFFKEQGIIVSAGHTNAPYQQIVESQVSAITHLFNAMRPFHHREPGIIGAALTTSLPFSLIVDGIHLHPATVKMAWNANPGSLFLISDAMAGLGMGDGTFQLDARTVTVHEGATKTLAGSIVGLDQAVRNLHAWTGCTLAEALEAASCKPAKLLGIYGRKGCLDVGSDADLILLDNALRVQATYVGGQIKNSIEISDQRHKP